MNHIDDILFEDRTFPIKIRPCRSSVTDNMDNARRALHEAIEIKYFRKGESTLLVGDKTVYAKAGDIIIINPYEIHATIDYGKENQGEYCLVMMGLDFFDGISAGIDLRHELLGKGTLFKTQIKSNVRMQEILTRIAEEDDSLPTYRLSLFGLMAELAALFLNEGVEKEQNATNPESAKYYAIIEPAIRMIRDNYSQPKLSVDALAAACNVSKYHFCHVFKSVTGFGAISYLNAYRLKIANNLLKTSNKSVSEIAFSCGFEDASYFSKLYKQKFNKTPKSDKSFATG